MRVAVGRGDLVRLVADLPSEQAARTAALLGFDAPIERDELPPTRVEVTLDPIAPPPIVPLEVASVPFWRLETMTFTDEPEPIAVARSQSGGLTEDELLSPDRSLFATPPTQPLAPWSRLWPVLRSALQTSVPGRDPDVPALVRALCRGKIVPIAARRRGRWLTGMIYSLAFAPTLSRRCSCSATSARMDRLSTDPPGFALHADCTALRCVLRRWFRAHHRAGTRPSRGRGLPSPGSVAGSVVR